MEQLFSTAIFHAPMVKDLDLLIKSGVNVYAFDFGYKGSMTLNEVFRLSPIKLVVNFFGRHVGTRLYQKEDLGVCHGDDMFYIFPFTLAGFPKPLKTPTDRLVSHRILTYISRFVSNGQPGMVDNVKWTSCNEKSEWLKITNTLKMETLDKVRQKRVLFWNDTIKPNETGPGQIDTPVTTLHSGIAERRSTLLDSQQLFT
jgi:carboxylesterase type B